MSGGTEASRLYLAAMFPSNRRVLAPDLTFLSGWKKNLGLGQRCSEEVTGLYSAVAPLLGYVTGS